MSESYYRYSGFPRGVPTESVKNRTEGFDPVDMGSPLDLAVYLLDRGWTHTRIWYRGREVAGIRTDQAGKSVAFQLD